MKKYVDERDRKSAIAMLFSKKLQAEIIIMKMKHLIRSRDESGKNPKKSGCAERADGSASRSKESVALITEALAVDIKMENSAPVVFYLFVTKTYN